MPSLSERRTRWLLLAALLGQLALLSAQVPDPSGAANRLQGTVLRTVAPLARLIAVISEGVGSVAGGLRSRGRLLDENARLRAEVELLRRQRAETFGAREELERVTAALEYTPPPLGRLRVADVVYIDHASWLQTLILYVGDARLEENQAVVSSEGLVGRVVVAQGPYAKVQLVTDRAASVGGMIERTRRQGVVRGSGRGALELAFVPLQADVQVGDRVLTAGIDGIFARGLPIGTVTSVEPGNELFHEIRLAPAVDFGVLDQVYVLEREPVPDEIKEALPDARP